MGIRKDWSKLPILTLEEFEAAWSSQNDWYDPEYPLFPQIDKEFKRIILG